MKQTIAMKQAAFEELMRTDEVAFYGPMESTYKIMAHISYGVPIIQLFEDGHALGTRDYSSPKRAINAIREILRCAGYEL